MKLNTDFVAQDIDDTQFLVPLGGEAFNGTVRSNKTAAFIVDCLKEDTTEAEIVDKMSSVYDAPREIIAADVSKILNTLREINALDEP